MHRLDCQSRCFRRKARAADQNEPPRAHRNKPAGRFESETAKTAGDQVGALGVGDERAPLRNGAFRLGVRRPHDDLSDVA